jgi:hypothetical protein
MTGRPPTVRRPAECSLVRQVRVASTWQERHQEDNPSRVWAFRGKSAKVRRSWQCLQVFMGRRVPFPGGGFSSRSPRTGVLVSSGEKGLQLQTPGGEISVRPAEGRSWDGTCPSNTPRHWNSDLRPRQSLVNPPCREIRWLVVVPMHSMSWFLAAALNRAPTAPGLGAGPTSLTTSSALKCLPDRASKTSSSQATSAHSRAKLSAACSPALRAAWMMSCRYPSRVPTSIRSGWLIPRYPLAGH